MEETENRVLGLKIFVEEMCETASTTQKKHFKQKFVSIYATLFWNELVNFFPGNL